MADQTPIVQLMQNLVGNAFKFYNGEPPPVYIFAQEGAEG